MILYRPVGSKKLELIRKGNYRRFPPELVEQSIFYPALNEQYTTGIASSWSVKYSEDHRGYITKFEINDRYCRQFEICQVRDPHHKELWAPTEKLNEFNEHVVGEIRITSEFSDR